LYYLIFALFFNTKEEELLIKENELLQSEYYTSMERMDLLDNVIEDLKNRDRQIYLNIFKSNPPDMFYDYNPGLYLQLDTSSDLILVNIISDKVKYSQFLSKEIETKIDLIYASLKSNRDLENTPSILPLNNLRSNQIGAGVGSKIHPFYKTMYDHTGVDILSGLGMDVIVTANGVVRDIVKSDRGRGNQIFVNHGNGYETVYAHLGDILVRKGQKVYRGDIIGRVGNSGLSFAPHLHYEVKFNNKIMDPINYFFANLTPAMYKEMLISSLNSGQSLD
jgi:murein DD-endopeptidase MepM/ murein hydrolase activator NlpD